MIGSRRVRGRALIGAALTAVLAFGSVHVASADDVVPGAPTPVDATATSPAPTGALSHDAPRALVEGSATAEALTGSVSESTRHDGPQDAAEDGTLTGQVIAPYADDFGNTLYMENVDVSAFRYDAAEVRWNFVSTVRTDAEGSFEFVGLPLGEYDIFFNPSVEQWPSVAFGWLSGDPNPRPSELEIVAGDNHLPFGAHTLGVGAVIDGVVKSESGLRPLDAVPVTLWASNGPDDDGTLQFYEIWTVATVSGQYLLNQLPEGYYVIRFDSPSPKYAGEWWQNKPSFATSDLIYVDRDHRVINANLKSKVDLGTVSVTGASATGATLKAVHTTRSGTTYKYGWFADGVYIAGASKNTFIPTAAQQHKRITVRVTGSKSGVVATTKASAPRAKTLLTAVPTISGSASIKNAFGPDTSFWKGSTLTAKPGAWTSGATLRYQWYADGKAISGASSSKYTLRPSDKYKRISVRVTGSKTDYGTFARTSAQTARVATVSRAFWDENPTATRQPGSRLDPFLWGQTLGVWAKGTTFQYYYYADGVLVGSSSSGILGGLDRFIGKRLQFRVVASNPGYETFTLWSNTTNPVKW